MEDQNGWHEYQKLVLYRLDKLDDNMKELHQAVGAVSKQVVILKAKAAMLGSIAGAVVAGLVEWLIH